MSRAIKGGILIAIAAFFWGISGTVAKILFNGNINPLRLVNMRLNIAFLILLIYFFVTDRNIIKIKKQDLMFFATLGIFGITGVQSTYYYTVSALNVSMAIFLQFLSPIIVTLYCVLFEREKMSIFKLAALASSLSGSFFIIFNHSGAVNIKVIGLISGIASAFFCAFYNIYSKRCTSRYNSWTVLFYSLGFGALLYWFVSPPWVVYKGLSGGELLFVLYIAIFATIIPFGLYLMGLKYLLPTTASIISMLEPVVASVSAFAILGESMGALQIVGGILVISAVFLVQWESYKNLRR